nr:tetratricopeptide repeat protein [Desulfovibrio sp.]
EILHLTDATFLPQPGDSLALLGQSPALSPDLDGHDPALSFLGAQDFLSSPPAEVVPQKSASSVQGETAALTPDAPETGAVFSANSGGQPDHGPTPSGGGEKRAASSFQSISVPVNPVGKPEQKGSVNLCGHGDFLNRFAQESEHCARFVLAIVRMEGASGTTATTALRLWEKLLRKKAGSAGAVPLAGLYGSNSLIFFHPGAEPQNVTALYEGFCTALKDEGIDAAAGLAAFPFLQYRKAEMPDCALKALEYALLLPHPRVGLCSSLALNISADRRYSLGDVFGALEEYKLSLLADETNVMAWNSLGVCMAALGRGHEARRHFLEALRHKPDDGAAKQTYYNLGNVCQSLGERRAAARYYRQCVKVAPDHLFAHIRLGQLCEQGGRRADARRYYELAAAIEDATPERPGVARRHLARLAARQRKGGEARELLHEALLRNPQDPASMLLLANIYLDGNEDPAMAELLARKSAGLHDRPEAWQTLARALRALDREDEARLAEARAVLG